MLFARDCEGQARDSQMPSGSFGDTGLNVPLPTEPKAIPVKTTKQDANLESSTSVGKSNLETLETGRLFQALANRCMLYQSSDRPTMVDVHVDLATWPDLRVSKNDHFNLFRHLAVNGLVATPRDIVALTLMCTMLQWNHSVHKDEGCVYHAALEVLISNARDMCTCCCVTDSPPTVSSVLTVAC